MTEISRYAAAGLELAEAACYHAEKVHGMVSPEAEEAGAIWGKFWHIAVIANAGKTTQ